MKKGANADVEPSVQPPSSPDPPLKGKVQGLGPWRGPGQRPALASLPHSILQNRLQPARLLFEQLAVVAVWVAEEGFVVAVFGDGSVVEDEDSVEVSDGGESVCDDDGGSAFHQAFGGLLDEDFGGAIEG